VIPARVTMPCEQPALDLDEALDHVRRTALRAGSVGTVGLELEGHLVDRDAIGRRVPWPRVQAAVAAVGDLPGGSRVTVEPGGQVELSGPPLADVGSAVAALRADARRLASALAGDRLALARLGADPLRPAERTSPAPRYAAMEEHFTGVGCDDAGRTMMNATAALQVNLDAGPENGWRDRVALAHRLGPVLVAVSACSPLLAGRPTGWRSARQKIWGELDQSRCGPLLGRREPAGEWAEYALAASVMLVRGPGGGAEPVRTRASFAEWATGTADLGRRPTTADLDYHLSTLFPPVRLRGWLEIRYLDAAPEPWWPALAALTVALLDDPSAADAAWAATAPVVGAWDRAARLGLADDALRVAAVACVAAAGPAVPPALQPALDALDALVRAGRSPGDVLLERAGTPTDLLMAALEECS
jgi:ergothioneine biosynthesis glutamate--cysteine ligase EgtA